MAKMNVVYIMRKNGRWRASAYFYGMLGYIIINLDGIG
jgi:hypothetical protein